MEQTKLGPMSSRTILAVALAVLALGCPKKEDAAADAAAEAAAVVTQAVADAAPTDTAAADAAAPTPTTKITIAKPTATPSATVAKANTCPASNQAAFVGGGGGKECHVTCNTNTDCSKNAPGTKCVGTGALMTPEGTRGGSMKFCQ
jgi:hypothetical protein